MPCPASPGSSPASAYCTLPPALYATAREQATEKAFTGPTTPTECNAQKSFAPAATPIPVISSKTDRPTHIRSCMNSISLDFQPDK
ncbi:MAG TPA: hypothetical protein VGM48_20520 [Puia sp.]